LIQEVNVIKAGIWEEMWRNAT